MAHDAKYHLLDPSHVFEAHDVVLAATYAQAKAYNRQWARERTAGAFGTVAQMFEQFFEALWELHGDGRQIALPAQRLATMKAALDDLGDPNLEARPHLPKVACSFMQAGAGLPAFERALTSKTLPQGEALLPAEAALLDACTAYRVRLSGLGLIEKGDALAYLLEHAAEAFPTCKKVCVLASAPLQPLHEHFLDELCRKGFIALERLTDNGEPCDSAQKTCVERAREGLAVQFAFPSGRYAAAQLVAQLVEKHHGEGPIVVSCKQPLAYYQALEAGLSAPRTCEEEGEAAASRPALFIAARASRPFAQTDFGRAYLSLCACLQSQDVPWNRAALADALQSPLLANTSNYVWSLDRQLRANRHASRQETIDSLCGNELFKAYCELACAPSLQTARAIEESFNRVKGYRASEIAEQKAALAVLVELVQTVSKAGCPPEEIVPTVLPLLESSSVDVRVANRQEGAGVLPDVTFVGMHQAAQVLPEACTTLVACDLDATSYPAAKKDNAAMLLLDKLGVPRGESATERLWRDWSGIMATPSKRIVLMRTLNDVDGNPTYPCAVLEEFVDCYREDVSTNDDIDNAFAIPLHLQNGQEPGFEPAIALGEEDHFADVAPSCPPPQLQSLPAQAAETAFAQQMVPATEGEAATDGMLVLSPSQIETYLACPFQWFMLRRLGADAPDESFGPAEAGIFRHDCMERFLRSFDKKVTLENFAEAEELLENVLDEVEREHRALGKDARTGNRYAPLPGSTEERALDLARQELHEWLAAECGFLRKVHAGECTEDNGWQQSTFEPKELEFDLAPFAIDYGGCRLVGRVDRIDVDEQRKLAVVVDYKGTLKTAHNVSRERSAPKTPYILPTNKVQALIYAGALQKSSDAQDVLGIAPCDEEAGLAVVGEVYMSYKRGNEVRGTYVNSVLSRAASFPTMGTKNTGMTPEEFSAILEDTESLVREKVVERILAGQIAPNPSGKDACTYCPITACPERLSNES